MLDFVTSFSFPLSLNTVVLDTNHGPHTLLSLISLIRTMDKGAGRGKEGSFLRNEMFPNKQGWQNIKKNLSRLSEDAGSGILGLGNK